MCFIKDEMYFTTSQSLMVRVIVFIPNLDIPIFNECDGKLKLPVKPTEYFFRTNSFN